jgi:dipeptidyl aminopeptidase/acylaminoacyl peptidase
LPGDQFPAYELNLFDVATKKPIRPPVDRIDFGGPRLHWDKDGRHFSYEKIDRGHQRYRVIRVDSQTGQASNLIDERSTTFIWTAHRESVGLSTVHWLDESSELLHASERDGWRHLYLIDGKTGGIKNPVTKGEYVVRGIDHIDEAKRQVWFRASGKNPGQDPYFLHHYRVNFDGTGLVALTEGHGSHSVQFSPDRRFLIDTFSRVDMAPIHELRRADDGKLVCALEHAEITALNAAGWQPPEVFVAKGRDRKTDIWGIICRPKDFDPHKKYPVIESIYAGPQGSFVPKTFSAARRFASLTDLGFIVVQIDGMGTANRSKAFHDVCWHNLKDAGFPDRILWHQAVARKYPAYDLTRMGITGVSAGGQNATA